MCFRQTITDITLTLHPILCLRTAGWWRRARSWAMMGVTYVVRITALIHASSWGNTRSPIVSPIMNARCPRAGWRWTTSSTRKHGAHGAGENKDAQNLRQRHSARKYTVLSRSAFVNVSVDSVCTEFWSDIDSWLWTDWMTAADKDILISLYSCYMGAILYSFFSV